MPNGTQVPKKSSKDFQDKLDLYHQNLRNIFDNLIHDISLPNVQTGNHELKTYLCEQFCKVFFNEKNILSGDIDSELRLVYKIWKFMMDIDTTSYEAFKSSCMFHHVKQDQLIKVIPELERHDLQRHLKIWIYNFTYLFILCLITYSNNSFLNLETR